MKVRLEELERAFSSGGMRVTLTLLESLICDDISQACQSIIFKRLESGSFPKRHNDIALASSAAVVKIEGDGNEGLTRFLFTDPCSSATPETRWILAREIGDQVKHSRFYCLELEHIDVVARRQLSDANTITSLAAGAGLVTFAGISEVAALIWSTYLSGVLLTSLLQIADYAVTYTTGRKSFNKALISHQAVALRVANITTGCLISKLFLSDIVASVDNRSAYIKSNQLDTYLEQHLPTLLNDCRLLMGGHGYLRAHPVSAWIEETELVHSLYGGYSHFESVPTN